jgi:hypothetical protein
MKKSLLTQLALFPFAVHSGVTSEFFCFEHSQSSPVKFEFRTFYDEASKWLGGFVKYAKSNVPISVVLTDSQHEEIDPLMPWQSTATWSEVVDEKVTGTCLDVLHNEGQWQAVQLHEQHQH